MSELYIGIREFRARFSPYLRRAKAGERIIITERGQPVGQLTAPLATLTERTRASVALELVRCRLRECYRAESSPHPPSGRVV